MKTMTAEQFNEKYPVGTKVLYWPWVREGKDGIPSSTRTPAWTLGNGDPLVSVYGKAGGILLTHIEVLPEAPIKAPPRVAPTDGMSPGAARSREERSIDPFDIVSRIEELEERQAQTDAAICALRDRPVAASEGS